VNPFVTPAVVEKAWGAELHLHNADGYAFKILRFNQGASLSLHHHARKAETWWVCSGQFLVSWIDPETAKQSLRPFCQGNAIHLVPGIDHRLKCVQVGDIAEASTFDDPDDSYRVEPSSSGTK